jgi:hypothetical protein
MSEKGTGGAFAAAIEGPSISLFCLTSKTVLSKSHAKNPGATFGTITVN